VWAPPPTFWARLPGRDGRRLRERYSPDLANAKVEHFTASGLAFTACAQTHGLPVIASPRL
jgi:hypothetical protein